MFAYWLSMCSKAVYKTVEPVYTHIRSMGHIEDSLLVGYEFTACKKNVFDTVDTFCSLGFIVHPDKSVFENSMNPLSGPWTPRCLIIYLPSGVPLRLICLHLG